MPPPMHKATTPRLNRSRRIECISRVANIAPVAPIGWPCAMAPPSTLTIVIGQAQLLHDRERDGGEGFVDFEAFDFGRESSRPVRAPS